MKFKDLLLGTFATAVILGSGVTIYNRFYTPKPTEADTTVMVIARSGSGEAIGLLAGKFNCKQGVRSVHMAPMTVAIGCAVLKDGNVEITEETGDLYQIPQEMFKPFK